MEGPWRRAEEVRPGIGRRRWSGRSERRRSQGTNLGVAEYPAVGVEDLQLDQPARRAEPVLRHRHRRLLPDDVPSEPYPGTPLELQAEAGHLGECRMDGRGEVRRLENDETGADPSGVRRQPADDDLLALPGARRQVDHEQVDRPTREEGTRECEPLGRIGRAQDDQPAQVYSPADCLEGVERVSEVEEGDDRPARLRLCHAAERERRLAARGGPADRRARAAREPPWTENRVERREAGRDDFVAAWRERIRHLLQPERVESGRQCSLGWRSNPCALQRGGGRRIHAGAASEPDGRTSPAGFEVGEGGSEGVVRH